MSDYEKELERTVEVLQTKLQESLESQERMCKNANSELYDVKALIGKFSDLIANLKRMEEIDYSSDEFYKKDKKNIEKQL